MKIKKHIIIALLVIIIFSCDALYILTSKNDISVGCIDDSKINDQIICIEVFDPVCGCNGKTYPNFCYAEREGVTDWSKGACD